MVKQCAVNGKPRDGNEKEKEETDANDGEKEMAEKEWREGSICHLGWVDWSDNARRMGCPATLTLNGDLACCHKYVQAPANGRRRVAGSCFAFFRPRNRRSLGRNMGDICIVDDKRITCTSTASTRISSKR